MVTISSILSAWLMSNQDYTEGVDIFQRLSNDKAQLSRFLRFRSHMTEARLKEEIEKLYSESKQTQAEQGHELDPTDALMHSLHLWLASISVPVWAANMLRFRSIFAVVVLITKDKKICWHAFALRFVKSVDQQQGELP
jgi:hypothetical protein